MILLKQGIPPSVATMVSKPPLYMGNKSSLNMTLFSFCFFPLLDQGPPGKDGVNGPPGLPGSKVGIPRVPWL